MRKLQSIQVLRGIAAMAVLVHHLVVTVDPSLRPWVIDGQMGVDLFFVISGFVMMLSVRELGGAADARRFVLRRLWRVAPLLYALTAAIILFRLIYREPVELAQAANCLTIVSLLPTIAPDRCVLYPAWTLAFELTFYLAVAAVVAFNPRHRAAAVIAIVAALALVPSSWWGAARYGNGLMIEFAFGVIAFELWRRGHVSRRVSLASCAAAVLLLIFPVGDARVLAWGLPMGLAFIAALRWEVGGDRVSRALLWLGTISYSLYLGHLVVFDALTPLLRPFVPEVGLAAILLVAAVAICGLIYKAIEEPLLRSPLYRHAPRYSHSIAQTSPGLVAADPMLRDDPLLWKTNSST